MLPNGEMGAVVSGGPVEGMLQVFTEMVLSMEIMMMRINTVMMSNEDEDSISLRHRTITINV